jgi:hypothetical protein
MLPKERPLILHPTYSFSQATAPNEGEENIRRTFLYRDLLGKETGKQSPFQSFSGCSGQQSVDLFFLFQPFPSVHKIYILKAETNFPESKWCVNNPEEEKHILPNPM